MTLQMKMTLIILAHFGFEIMLVLSDAVKQQNQEKLLDETRPQKCYKK